MTLTGKGTIILMISSFMAALGWAFSKQALTELPPLWFMGSRFLLASFCLFIFCYKKIFSLSKQELLRAMMVGLLMAGGSLSWVMAMSVTDTFAEGAFITSLAMIFAPFIAWIFFKQRPHRMFWIALPFALIGLGFLSLSDGFKLSASQIWFLSCAVFVAFHVNFNAKYARSISSISLACIQLATVGALAVILSLFFESWPQQTSASIWGWFFASVLIATSLRYGMQTLAQKHLTATNAALIMILEPVWASLISVIFYGEVLSFGKLLGCLLILWGLLVYSGGLKWLEQRAKKNATL